MHKRLTWFFIPGLCKMNYTSRNLHLWVEFFYGGVGGMFSNENKHQISVLKCFSSCDFMWHKVSQQASSVCKFHQDFSYAGAPPHATVTFIFYESVPLPSALGPPRSITAPHCLVFSVSHSNPSFPNSQISCRSPRSHKRLYPTFSTHAAALPTTCKHTLMCKISGVGL